MNGTEAGLMALRQHFKVEKGLCPAGIKDVWRLSGVESFLSQNSPVRVGFAFSSLSHCVYPLLRLWHPHPAAQMWKCPPSATETRLTPIQSQKVRNPFEPIPGLKTGSPNTGNCTQTFPQKPCFLRPAYKTSERQEFLQDTDGDRHVPVQDLRCIISNTGFMLLFLHCI